MVGLTGRMTRNNNPSAAEQGLQQGIRLNIARNGAKKVQDGITASVAADAENRAAIFDQFATAGREVPPELIEQMDQRTELRRQSSLFQAAAPEIAAQLTQDFDPVTIAENESILNNNIEQLTRGVRNEQNRVDRLDSIAGLANTLGDLKKQRIDTGKAQQELFLKEFEVAEEKADRSLDEFYGNMDKGQLAQEMESGSFRLRGVTSGRFLRYMHQRENDDIDVKRARLGLRKDAAELTKLQREVDTKLNDNLDKQIKNSLLKVPVPTLLKLQAEANANGSVTVAGTKISQVQIGVALNTINSTGENQRALLSDSVSIDKKEEQLLTEMYDVGRVLGMVNGQDGTFYAAAGTRLLEEEGFKIKSEAAELFPTDPVKRQQHENEQREAFVTQKLKEAQQARKDSIAALPKSAQLAVQNIEHSGQISSRAVAFEAMTENFPFFASVPKDSAYSGAARIAFDVITGTNGIDPKTKQKKTSSGFAALTQDKKKEKLKNEDLDGMFDQATRQKMRENLGGLIAQKHVNSVLGNAIGSLEEGAQQQMQQLMFDQRGNLRSGLLVQGREQQINWAPTVQLMHDVIVTNSIEQTDEGKRAEADEFLETVEDLMVNTGIRNETLAEVAPQTLVEHQTWAIARLTDEAGLNYQAQGNFLLNLEQGDFLQNKNDLKKRLAQEDTTFLLSGTSLICLCPL